MPNFHSSVRLNGTKLRLMLSEKASTRFAHKISAVLGDVRHEIALLESLTLSTGNPGIHIGFITRDVIADSGSGTSVALARFADVARRSSALAWVQACAVGPDRPMTPHSASHSSTAYDNVGEIFLDNLA